LRNAPDPDIVSSAAPSMPTILVVDDDLSTTELLEGWLKSVGYDTRVAADGDEALASIRNDPPSLVLLDLLLPKRNGLVVLAEVRGNPRTKSLPVFIISARDAMANVDAAFAGGANEFLIKPLQPERLLLKIKKHLTAKPS
jgi:CheY-like chemotaxis protein